MLSTPAHSLFLASAVVEGTPTTTPSGSRFTATRQDIRDAAMQDMQEARRGNHTSSSGLKVLWYAYAMLCYAVHHSLIWYSSRSCCREDGGDAAPSGMSVHRMSCINVRMLGYIHLKSTRIYRHSRDPLESSSPFAFLNQFRWLQT